MGGSILVVEDELVTQRLIAASLERAGYKVTLAPSVAHAEAAIRDVIPDLMLLDWILPGTTGVSFLRQLRNERRTKQIPIIMLTGRAEEFDKVTGLEAGADDYLTKPFSHRELLARIKAVVRRRAPLLGDEPVEFGDLKLDPAAHRVSTGRGANPGGPDRESRSGEIMCSSRTERSTCTFAVCGRRCSRAATRS